MTEIDINSDLGESFGPWRIGDDADEQILSLVSSANVATGFHAGDPGTMRQTVALAAQLGVSLGAHPGYRDLVGFGRRHLNTTPQELIDDILYQLGALREFAALHGVPLRHIKPHGALYMHLAQDEVTAEAFITTLRRLDPALKVFCMHGSAVWRVATAHGQPTVCEFYADRDYNRSGSIVFTRRVAPLSPEVVANKVLHACQQGRVQTVEGEEIEILFSSVCLHSDTPDALELLQAIVQRLRLAGITIAAPR